MWSVGVGWDDLKVSTAVRTETRSMSNSVQLYLIQAGDPIKRSQFGPR